MAAEANRNEDNSTVEMDQGTSARFAAPDACRSMRCLVVLR
jgi:hypothetical protein